MTFLCNFYDILSECMLLLLWLKICIVYFSIIKKYYYKAVYYRIKLLLTCSMVQFPTSTRFTSQSETFSGHDSSLQQGLLTTDEGT